MINYIDDNLAVGSVNDIKDADKRDQLRQLGFSFIIDIRILFTQPKANTLDDCNPDMKLIKEAVDSLVALSEKHKIVIHCHGGIDRAPFIAMLYMKKKNNMTYGEAYDEVSYRRPQTIPHWEWVDLFWRNIMHYTITENRSRWKQTIGNLNVKNQPATIREFPTIEALNMVIEDGDNVMRIIISNNNKGRTTIRIMESTNNKTTSRWTGGPLVEQGKVRIMYEDYDLSTPIAVAAALKE